jgi:ribosome-associated translation inhibitor RaiA
MASDTPPGVSGTDEREYTSGQLLAMDEEEARQTLTVAQYERREKLQELHAEAAETRETWAEEEEIVADVAIHADPESLGTEVDLYGNSVLVQIEEDDSDFAAAIEGLEAEFGDIQREEVHEMNAGETDALVRYIARMYDAMLLRWNDHDWAGFTDREREAILADARDAWGDTNFVLGMFDCVEAHVRERDERVAAVKSFLGEEGSGGRRDSGRDGLPDV